MRRILADDAVQAVFSGYGVDVLAAYNALGISKRYKLIINSNLDIIFDSFFVVVLNPGG